MIYYSYVNQQIQPTSIVDSMSRRFSTAIFGGAGRNNSEAHHGVNGDHCHQNHGTIRIPVVKYGLDNFIYIFR